MRGLPGGALFGTAWEGHRCEGEGWDAGWNPFSAYWALRRAQANPFLAMVAPEAATAAGTGAAALVTIMGTVLARGAGLEGTAADVVREAKAVQRSSQHKLKLSGPPPQGSSSVQTPVRPRAKRDPAVECTPEPVESSGTPLIRLVRNQRGGRSRRYYASPVTLSFNGARNDMMCHMGEWGSNYVPELPTPQPIPSQLSFGRQACDPFAYGGVCTPMRSQPLPRMAFGGAGARAPLLP